MYINPNWTTSPPMWTNYCPCCGKPTGYGAAQPNYWLSGGGMGGVAVAQTDEKKEDK